MGDAGCHCFTFWFKMALPTCECLSLYTLLEGRLSSKYLSELWEENAKRAERPFRSIRDTAEGERAERRLCHRTQLPWHETRPQVWWLQILPTYSSQNVHRTFSWVNGYKWYIKPNVTLCSRDLLYLLSLHCIRKSHRPLGKYSTRIEYSNSRLSHRVRPGNHHLSLSQPDILILKLFELENRGFEVIISVAITFIHVMWLH